MATLPLSCPQDAVQDVVAEVLDDMIDIVASDPPLLLIPPLPGRQLGVHQPNIEVETDAEVKLFTDLAAALCRRTQ
jgi:hypothetical protein